MTMAKHAPQDEHENLSPDGGQAKTPASVKVAQKEFEKALRAGNQPDPRPQPSGRA